MDAVLAIALLAVLITALLLSIGYAKRGSRELAKHRAAMSRAEETLVALQDGAAATPDENVTVTDLKDPAPAGFRWVQVRAVHHDKTAQLAGLVPQQKEARP